MLIALALLAQAPDFDTAANAFLGCLRATVQMGMTTRMDPEAFRQGFAQSCRDEEARFREAAIATVMQQGRSREEAVAEVEGNITNGRRIFAGDQEAYIRTGRVPR